MLIIICTSRFCSSISLSALSRTFILLRHVMLYIVMLVFALLVWCVDVLYLVLYPLFHLSWSAVYVIALKWWWHHSSNLKLALIHVPFEARAGSHASCSFSIVCTTTITQTLTTSHISLIYQFTMLRKNIVNSSLILILNCAEKLCDKKGRVTSNFLLNLVIVTFFLFSNLEF
jgi:hypothetical protein